MIALVQTLTMKLDNKRDQERIMAALRIADAKTTLGNGTEKAINLEILRAIATHDQRPVTFTFEAAAVLADAFELAGERCGDEAIAEDQAQCAEYIRRAIRGGR